MFYEYKHLILRYLESPNSGFTAIVSNGTRNTDIKNIAFLLKEFCCLYMHVCVHLHTKWWSIEAGFDILQIGVQVTLKLLFFFLYSWPSVVVFIP